VHHAPETVGIGFGQIEYPKSVSQDERKPKFPLHPVTPPSESASQEREHGDNEEDDEDDLRHSHEGTCNSSKAEERSDQRNDEASDCKL